MKLIFAISLILCVIVTYSDADDNLPGAVDAVLQTAHGALHGVGKTLFVLPAGLLKTICQLLDGGILDAVTAVLFGANSCGELRQHYRSESIPKPSCEKNL